MTTSHIWSEKQVVNNFHYSLETYPYIFLHSGMRCRLIAYIEYNGFLMLQLEERPIGLGCSSHKKLFQLPYHEGMSQLEALADLSVYNIAPDKTSDEIMAYITSNPNATRVEVCEYMQSIKTEWRDSICHNFLGYTYWLSEADMEIVNTLPTFVSNNLERFQFLQPKTSLAHHTIDE